jgi:hypothetical protein
LVLSSGEKNLKHFAVLAPTGARVGRAPSGHLSPAKSAVLREHGKHVQAYLATFLRESRKDGSFQQSCNPHVIESTVKKKYTVRTGTKVKDSMYCR